MDVEKPYQAVDRPWSVMLGDRNDRVDLIGNRNIQQSQA